MKNYFDVPSDHHIAMDEMHRRVAAPIPYPSVIWHIALWPKPEIRSSENIKDQHKNWNVWLDQVNTHLSALEMIISNNPSAGDSLQFPTEQRVHGEPRRSLEYVCQGLDFLWRIKAESHYEYITLTVVLSLKTQRKLPKEEAIPANWPKAFKNVLREDLSDAVEALRSPEKLEESERKQKIEAASELLHTSLWSELAEAVCNHPSVGKTLPVRFPGRLLADFRELVIEVPKSVYEENHNSIDLSQNNSLKELEEKKENRANKIVNFYEPVFDIVQQNGDHREVIVCAMLDWQAIYITALGETRKEGDDNNTKDSNPVRSTFFVIGSINSHQIGRLIERVNALGVARIAALVKLATLREIGRVVQALGLRLDKVISQATEADENLSNSLPAKDKLEEQIKRNQRNRQKLNEILDIQTQLNNLKNTNVSGTKTLQKSDNLNEENDTKISDGVTYRIARSSYYASLIETRLPDLRTKRVEGWQPYDEFLRRRLFPTLNFIQNIGKRIKALRTRTDSAILSLESMSSRYALDAMVMIQGDQNRSAEAQDRLNRKIAWLTALTVFIGILSIIVGAAVSFEGVQNAVVGYLSGKK